MKKERLEKRKKVRNKFIIGTATALALVSGVYFTSKYSVNYIKSNSTVVFDKNGNIKSKDDNKIVKIKSNIYKLARINDDIQSRKIDVLSAQNTLNQQYLINDNSGVPVSQRNSKDIFAYNTAAQAINQKILAINKDIRRYNKYTKNVADLKWFKESGLPSGITELNYVYTIGDF